MEALLKMIVAYMKLQQAYNIERSHPFCAGNRKDIQQILSTPLDESIKEIMLFYDEIKITNDVQAKIEELAQAPEAFKGLLLHEIYEMVLSIQDKRKQALEAIKYKNYKERYNWAKNKIATDYPELVTFTSFGTDKFKNELLKLLK